MRIQAFWRLLWINLRRNAGHLLLSSLGIIVGTGSFVFFVALGTGVKQIVSQDLLGVLPVNQVEVVPKSFQLGMFKVGQSNLFGGNQLTSRVLRRIRSMPEVKSVFGKMNMRAPAYAYIPIPKEFRTRVLSQGFQTELMAQGIDPKSIPKKDLGGASFSYKKGKPVPILVSRRLLDLYNATLADTRGFPKLTAQFARIVQFRMIVGRSAFRRKDHPKGTRIFKCRVVGVSNRAILLGITVPLRFVQEMNLFYNPKQRLTYQSAIIEAHKNDDMPKLLEKLEKMGLTLEASHIFARKIGNSILFITLLLTLISGVILLISAISISHTFLMSVIERRYQLGLMRAVGATRGNIRSLIMTEAAIVGLISGVAGLALTYGVIALLQWALPHWQSLPFDAKKLFSFPPWLPFLALAFAPLFCLIGAFFPAQSAAHVDPASVMSQK